MIPNRAITKQGGQSTVRVLTGDVFEQRVVTTGISNTQYTEITGGLSEGEKVVIQTTASTTAITNQSSSPMGGPPDGGGGPPPF